MGVSKRVRFEILRRDDHTCRYCGGVAPDVRLTVDHVVPVALGGSDEPTNLVTACQDCNAGKTSTSPSESHVADVAADAIRWADAMKLAAEQIRLEREARADDYTEFHQKWHSWTFMSGGKTHYMHGGLPADYVDTLQRYRDLGMTMEDIFDGFRVLEGIRWCPKDPFAYFLGIMNNKASALQDRARDILDGGV